ncbi:hypothetical protein SRHO_G00068440 [Serrasalmus rhombeus]
MADKDIATEMQDPEVPHEEEEESVHDEPLEGNPAQEVEVNTETDVTEDKRKRRFTEKGQELHNEKLKKFQRNFDKTYEKWKVLAKEAKKALSLPNSTKVLHEHQIQIHTADLEVKERYEDVRKYSVPDADTRRRVDTCDAVSKQLIERLHVLQDEDTDKHLPTVRAPWGNTGSVFSCQEDQVSMLSPPFSGRVSKRSSVSSTKKQEAEAELAATKATLKVLAEMEQEEKELERLEAENRRQLAQQEAENAERHKLLEEKRRQLKRLEATKRMNAAKARLQVYEQDVGSDEEISDLLHNHNLPPLKANALPRYSMPSQSASKLPTTTYEVPKPTSQVARPTFHDNSTTMLAEAIAESINTSRLPVPEPPIFSGDPIRYKDWKMSFLTLIGRKNIPVNEKIYYLRKYVTGAAKKAIESYFLVGTEEAYYSAWEILEERYGNSFVVAKAFRDKLNSWTKIGPKDSVELREFADFLRGCQAAMSHIKSLEVLNDCSENQRILSKLPDWLTARWNRKVMEFEEETQDFPSFHTFVEFVSREAKIACNPMTSLHALKSGDAEMAKPSKVRNVGAKVLASASEEKPDVEGQRGNAKGCMFCEKTNHGIQTCRKLIEKPIKERVKYVQTKKLCFACLRPGHHSKSCEKRSVCNVCTGRHPTCLHEDRAKADEKIQADGQNESGKPSKGKEKPKEQKHGDTESTTTEVTSTAMSNQVMHNRNSTYASTIVPVWLSTTRNPDAEVLVYALLDSQSDSTFILQERAETLDTQMEPVQLKLSTLASKRTVIPSHKLVGLQVRGFYSSKKIPLPVTYSRDFIPASLSHIPTPKTARAWSHLEHLAEEIAPLIDCDVGLLIGYNCSQALLPREIVSGKDDEPFAVRTDLGWSIVGCVNPCVDYGDAIGSSHRIIVKQVTPSLQSSSDLTNQVQYICRTQVKEVIVPTDVLKVLESDFSERNVEDAHFSQDDLHFIMKMEKGIKTQANGQREMPLPFKEDKPCLPNNLKCADHCLRCLKRRFEKDKQYHKDYVAFMSDIISCGDAEKVPESEFQQELPSGNVEVEDVAVEDPEVRNVFVHKASATEVLLLDRFLKFSCWTRLVKAIARLMRLTEELKGSIPRTNEATSLVERSDAEATIISLVQREAFAEEIQTLQHRKELVKTSNLHKLNPFLDKQGILRVGGRLTHADLHHHIKHPAVLPAKGHVTRLLIQHYHQQVQHQGRGITVNELRANGFWILGCSHAVSSCINKCVKCRRFRRSTENQLMADLPRDRMEETPPFTYCGIDCFGPFYVKDGRKESKRYGLLFTCLCSRAVHIELLEEMTTDFFIIALRAFIAIRGNVRQLRCDQGTNFVGARREFIEALKEMDQERLKILGCEFFMNPPSASHMGGAWERQIRTIRSVLTSILDQSSNRLDTSSLRTYFYEVMAIINSRPLTAHLLNDPMGPQPLSPNHILTMKSSIILPPPGKFEREDLYLRKRWRKVQHLANEFWSRWRKEYLLNLQPRQKWQRKRRNAKVNDIVIVQDDTAPRTEWKLAKVTKVYPAEDGYVRKLQLLISDSTLDKEGKRIGKPVYLERPIHKTVTLIEAE